MSKSQTSSVISFHSLYLFLSLASGDFFPKWLCYLLTYFRYLVWRGETGCRVRNENNSFRSGNPIHDCRTFTQTLHLRATTGSVGFVVSVFGL